MSDGSYLASLDSFKRHEARLRKAQQAMSRKTKFSSNWKQAKARVQRIHARIGNTSGTCPSCRHISKDNRQTQARFLCVECGFKENADPVGAINVLRAGHARFA